MSDSNLEKILIIDDNSDYRKLINTFISKLLPGTEVIELDPVFEGVPDDSYNWSDIDVLLLDYHLSIIGTTGLDILHKHHKKNTFPATIMLTGAGTEEIAVRALKTGIYEYLPKQSLTKDKLKQSVIHAWEAKKAERKKKQELTQHNRSFSKEVFYENLERAFDSNLPERALIIIKPDDLDLIEEQIGVIGKDRLINYIAKNSYDTFKLGACNPNITKISDKEIGIQIDYPINLETLSFNMQGLCDHLAKSTFKFAEEKYVFSVSIGVLKLGLFNKTAEQLISIASTACDNASNSTGNSFYIWQDSDPLPELIEQSQNNVIETETLSTKGNEEVEARIKAAEEEKEKLQAQLKAKEEAEKAQAALKAEQEAKEKAETEARIKAAEEEKEKLQAQLKAKEEAEKAQAALKAEQEAKEKAEAKMLAIEEEKKKLEAQLKAKEEAEKAQAALKAEQEAKIKAAEEEKKKAQAEAKIKAAEEERKKLEAELKAKEQAEKAQAVLQAEQEAKEKAEAESKIKTAEEEKKRLEAELKAREEQAKAKAALQAEQEAKEKAEAEAKIKAAEEERKKLEAELKAKEQAEKAQAVHAEQEAKEKAEAEAKIKAAEEEKEKLQAQLRAKEEAEKAQVALRAEQEAKEKAEAQAKIKAAEEEKEKLLAQLKAKEEAEKAQVALRAEQEAKEKAEAQAKIKAAEEEKEKLLAQLKAKEEAEKAQAALNAEQEAKEKAEAEAKMNAARQEKEKLEAELNAIAKAKEEAEAEMQAAREEKEKLEAELKAIAEAKTKQEADQKTQADTPAEKSPDSKEVTPEITATKETENTNAPQEEVQEQAEEKAAQETKQEDEESAEPSIEEIEAQINKLIGENKIIQTYQPVTAMFEDEEDPREIYKTGLQVLSENETLDQYLADISVFSLTLQQAINEWILRQIFLRITESGTSDCQYRFLVSATESWFADIALFQWLQKILQQTKKYSPGKSIILDVPLDLFIKHQKRAQALIDTLRKTHGFTVSLSNLNTIENLSEYCSLTTSKLLIVNTEQLQKLSELLAPNSVEKSESDNEEEQEEKQSLLQYIKSKNIRIITSGIEDSTLLTNAITAGTDYTLGDFVGEIQESLTESSMVESFELT